METNKCFVCDEMNAEYHLVYDRDGESADMTVCNHDLKHALINYRVHYYESLND